MSTRGCARDEKRERRVCRTALRASAAPALSAPEDAAAAAHAAAKDETADEAVPAAAATGRRQVGRGSSVRKALLTTRETPVVGSTDVAVTSTSRLPSCPPPSCSSRMLALLSPPPPLPLVPLVPWEEEGEEE